MTVWAEISREEGVEVLTISGAWVADALGEVERALEGVQKPRGTLIVDGSGLESLDSSGAWLLVSWLRRQGVDAQPRGFSEARQDLLALMEKIEHPESRAPATASPLTQLVTEIGAHTVELNLEPSEGVSHFAEKIHGPASAIVPDFVRRLLAN